MPVLAELGGGGALPKVAQPPELAEAQPPLAPCSHSWSYSCGSASSCSRHCLVCARMSWWCCVLLLLQSHRLHFQLPRRIWWHKGGRWMTAPVRAPSCSSSPWPLSMSSNSHTGLLGACGCSFLRHETIRECSSLPCYLELISGEGKWFPCWPLLVTEPTTLLISGRKECSSCEQYFKPDGVQLPCLL